ncbi:hypothetical protein M433DRAFT_155639 [Acidomyces richmondensis BFW]|nr:MAG: hypothetical protein FE78DRAFT_92463 [Acidomyces sp. 'richmondensis']KYG44428.1 hypothetical protein M433DRAFT_155639 [Acidomyces richmondensis BFW]
MASLHLHNDSPMLQALKGFSVGTTLFIAGSMTTTSLQFLPSLVLATQARDTGRSRSSRMESGRLTPQPTSVSEKQLHLTPGAAFQGQIDDAMISTRGYKLAAQQFSMMSKTAFVTQVPPELLTILASGFMAYHFRNVGHSVWIRWAAVAGLVVSVFPLTGGLMVPLDHKIARLAGEEAAVEPYEDAPPDREAERNNAEEFLKKWNNLNMVRAGIMAVAGGIGVWSLLE